MKLVREVLSDSDDDLAPTNCTPTSIGDPARPWRAEFLAYLETVEATPPASVSTIRWWGVCKICSTQKINADDSS